MHGTHPAGFQIEKTSLNVTAIGVDEAGNVWTGHAKGLVRVRPRQQWEFFWEDKMAFAPNAVKAIAFDEEGRAWVGDDAGRIKVGGGWGGCVCVGSRSG